MYDIQCYVTVSVIWRFAFPLEFFSEPCRGFFSLAISFLRLIVFSNLGWTELSVCSQFSCFIFCLDAKLPLAMMNFNFVCDPCAAVRPSTWLIKLWSEIIERLLMQPFHDSRIYKWNCDKIGCWKTDCVLYTYCLVSRNDYPLPVS